MNKKLLSIFLLLFIRGSLFSANIAICNWQEMHSEELSYLDRRLIEAGHTISHIWEQDNYDEFDVILTSNFMPFLEQVKYKVILSCYEPDVIINEHTEFDRLCGYMTVFTWNHRICNLPGFEKFYYPTAQVRHGDKPKMVPFHERSFACMVNSYLKNAHPKELYSIRRNVVKFYQKFHPDMFSVYGFRGWESGFKKVFKGEVTDKATILQKHKFNYCFENWDNDYHYISEKIFDSFNCLCVPIYLGSSNVTDFIPKETFIDARKFRNIKTLHAFIDAMDEETYQGYIDAIIKYSQTETPRLFTEDYHKDRILEIIDAYVQEQDEQNFALK